MMHRISPLARVAALVAALGTLGAGAAAQSITGRVALAGWNERVPGARVQLLGPDLDAVAMTVSDDDGRFLFTGVDAGQYYLQATFEGTSSALKGPLHVPRDDLSEGVLLELPNELYDKARACLGAAASGEGVVRDSTAPIPTTGVLAGVAYDEVTTTPLPGAQVTIAWGSARSEDQRLMTHTDPAGRFVFCSVPARIPLTVRLDVLGRVNAQHTGVRVQPGALARMDLSALLTATSRLTVLGSTAAEGPNPDSLATLQGQLLDAITEEPIADAAISVDGVEGETATDRNGFFRVSGVPPGERSLSVTRLGYDWRSEAIDVGAGSTVTVELRAAPDAIGLDAVVVRVSTPEMRMAKAATQAPRVLSGTQLGAAEERAQSVEDVIRLFPSLQIRHGQFETELGVERGTCIESSRALMRFAIPEKKTPLPWCEMIAVIIDGAAVFRATELVPSLRLRNVESIEFLPPTGALRYGERAALNGALVIWTRGRGPHQDAGRWIHP